MKMEHVKSDTDECTRLMDSQALPKAYKSKNDRNAMKPLGDNKRPNELVTFNVSGRKFVTTSHTLYSFPESLIGTSENRRKLKRTKDGEIFLDRNADVFESILTFYQTGIFEPPPQVNQNIFVADIKFYQLVKEAMQSGLQGFDALTIPMPKNKVQSAIWSLLEYPKTSKIARLISIVTLLVIVASIVTFCWESVPEYNSDKVNIDEIPASRRQAIQILQNIELFCIIYFSIEITARFASSPQKIPFLKDFLNIVDIVSVIPFYITLIFDTEDSLSIYFLRAVRLIRVFRIFKLSRHSNEMKILGFAIKESGRELVVLVFFIFLSVILFSSVIYYAEDGAADTKLTSIPGAFWWSIVTMTTLGYGDVVPVTVVGKIVGGVCAMMGILVIAMPIPIIVNSFTRQYQSSKPASKYWRGIQEPKVSSGNNNETVIGLYDADYSNGGLDGIDTVNRNPELDLDSKHPEISKKTSVVIEMGNEKKLTGTTSL